jgi:hypothetical protein
MSKCILFNNKKRCLPGAYSVIGKREYSPEISGGGIVDPEPPEGDVKDALLLVDKNPILLTNGNYIKLVNNPKK